MISFGLTAGLRMDEMAHMQPGLIIDLFLMRRLYDDEQHRIKRSRPSAYEEE